MNLTLWESVVWAYRDQKAHILLRHPYQWFCWAIADARLIEDGPQREVDPDAAAIHGEVLELGKDAAQTIIRAAVMAMQPEAPTLMPMPYPTTPDRAGYSCSAKDQRWGRAKFQGLQQQYLVITDDRVAEIETIYETVGKRTRVVGTKAHPISVEYCPLTWLPDLKWVQSEAIEHRDWVLAMVMLWHRIDRLDLRDSVIHDLGFVPEYLEVEPPMVNDARTSALDAVYPRRVVAVDRGSQDVVPSSDRTRLYGVRARAKVA